jgi:DNA-directed RNA polymerase specialized sigma24 family protein
MMASLPVATADGKVRAENMVGADFDELYRREFPKLLRIATALCGRRDLGEELVQDAMVKVLARWSTVRAYDKPEAYCRRVLINATIGLRRRQRWEKRALARDGAGKLSTLPPEADEFWSLVRALPARQMQVIVLYYADDRAVVDIASVLGVAEGTVRATLHQARESLRAQLEDGAE